MTNAVTAGNTIGDDRKIAASTADWKPQDYGLEDEQVMGVVAVRPQREPRLDPTHETRGLLS